MRNLVLFFVLFIILGIVFAMPADILTVSGKSSSSTSKQGGWIPDDPPEPVVTPVYNPPARTGVTEPDASTTWRHDETGVEVKWRGLGDGLFKIELHRNGSFVVQLSSWIEGVSSFTKQAAVSSNWGSGSGFQVRLIDDLGNEYWSEEFQIRSDVDISFPNSTSCWSTGTTSTGVVWEGCQGNTIKCDIYKNGSYLDDFSAWISNSGSYERNAPVPASWGTGSGYSVHVMDDQGNEGFSEEFEIGSIPVVLNGNTVEWNGGLVAVKVELYEGDSFVADLSGWIDNTGSFNLQNANIPSGYSPGRGECRIRVSDRRDGFGWAGGSSLSFGSSGPVEGMEFISIPSGTFQMGSPSSESNRDSDESRHSVRVSSFELMSTEVTQGMWEDVMGTNPSSGCGVGSNYPVYNVSWNDCQEFIEKLNDLDPNHTYRLPTEAEWEYARRAGTSSAYYWGSSSSESTMKAYCWYSKNANSSSWTSPHASSSGTQPVGTRQANAWGLYDMSGNVWEWCQDVYTSDYSNCPTDGRAYSGQGSYRVNRGGSWNSYARYCRSANRINYSPGYRRSNLGVRLARS